MLSPHEALRQLHEQGGGPALRVLQAQLPELQAQAESSGDAACQRLWAEALLACALHLPRHARLAESIRLASQALLIHEQAGDVAGQCDAHCTLALAYTQLEVGREAMEQALLALDLARQLGDTPREAWALVRLGNAYQALGDPVQARETTQQAREIGQRLDDADIDFTCLSNQAYYTLEECEHLMREADLERVPMVQGMAQALAQQALLLAQRQARPYRVAVALSNFVDALLLGGDWLRIEPLIAELEESCAQQGLSKLCVDARLQRARLAYGTGQLALARQLAEALQHDADPAKTRRLERRTLELLYLCAKQTQDTPRALYHLEQLLDTERRATRQAQAVQTQTLLIRQEVRQAMQRAAHAQADAQAARARAAALEQEQRQLRERLTLTEHAALEDLLTRLANRRHAESLLPVFLARSEHEPMALAMLDIDHFKQVNDRFGHAVGDKVLREFARLMRQQLRDADLLARWGGEEFLVALLGDGARAVPYVLERLRTAVAAHDWEAVHSGLSVTVSVGFTFVRPGGTPPTSWQPLLKRADQALYRAKAGGRNQVASA